MKKFITLSLILIYVTVTLSFLGVYTYNSPTKFLSNKNYITLSKEEYLTTYDKLSSSKINLSVYQLAGSKGRFYYTNNICEFSKEYISNCNKPSLHNEVNDKIDTRMLSYTIENISKFNPHSDSINIFFDDIYTQDQVNNYVKYLGLSEKNIQKNARPFESHNVFIKEYILLLIAVLMLTIYLLFSLLNKNRKYISIMLLEGYNTFEIIWTLNKNIIITFLILIPFVTFLFQIIYFDFWDINLLLYYISSLIFTLLIFSSIWFILSLLFIKKNILYFLKGRNYNKFFQVYMIIIKTTTFIFIVSLIIVFFFSVSKYNNLVKYDNLEKQISSGYYTSYVSNDSSKDSVATDEKIATQFYNQLFEDGDLKLVMMQSVDNSSIGRETNWCEQECMLYVSSTYFDYVDLYAQDGKKISSNDFKNITTPIFLVPESDNTNQYTEPIDGKIIKIKDNQKSPFIYTNSDFFESRTLINTPIKVFPNHIISQNYGLISPLSQGNFIIFGDENKIQNLLDNLKIDESVQFTSIDYQYNHNLDSIIKNSKNTLYKLITALIFFIGIMIYLIIFQFKIQIKKISIYALEGYSTIKKYEDIIFFSIISYAIFYLLSINNIRVHFHIIKISFITTITLLILELIILIFVDKHILNNKIKDYLKGRDD